MRAPARVVLPAARAPENVSVCFAQDLVSYVIVECIKDLGGLAHHAARLPRDWRQQTLEANSSDRQFSLDDRVRSVSHRSERCGYGADQAFHLTRGECESRLAHS